MGLKSTSDASLDRLPGLPEAADAPRKTNSIVELAWIPPSTVALVVGFLGQSATLGAKTFLLIELRMTVFIPLLNAVIASGGSKPHRHQGK